jgi:hypothetical protein
VGAQSSATQEAARQEPASPHIRHMGAMPRATDSVYFWGSEIQHSILGHLERRAVNALIQGALKGTLIAGFSPRLLSHTLGQAQQDYVVPVRWFSGSLVANHAVNRSVRPCRSRRVQSRK